ncbi:MAG: FecR domain-containing protein [Bacteroidales bacterium]|nr:FecR domain-containing protein [Bacteroidales bacterium]
MSNNIEHIDHSKLLLYLQNELSVDEKHLVEQWLEQDSQNRNTLEELEKVWIEIGKLKPAPVAVDTPMAWSKMSERIDQHENFGRKAKGVSISMIVRYSLRIAAVFVLAFGLFKVLIQPEIKTQEVVLTAKSASVSDSLPDGTFIALNSGSKLIYPEKFKKKERRVVLEGEGYFEVEHQPKQPFIIEAGDGNIKVLGTSFNVKAYPNSDVEVSVAKGRVQLFKLDKNLADTVSVILEAGEKGWLKKGSLQPKKIGILKPDAIFWLNKMLIFKKTELDKVFQILEKHYQVSINVSDSTIDSCRLSATFRNENIGSIMEVIAATFSLEIVKEEQTYLLKGNGCLCEEK